ncbi:type I-E CRISPR-associated protein Cse2/CasB [Fibrella sp. HMF5335]|uniref:Type I-E CRISPR-associated protein Cse2/CasB n=1 Tax=Fibrella rubiginis TaxID=2817060 RepID=A0A939K4R5_9BACT|nr:type I-E CRISPR-associated protein Cse2/CasB [Fibrella rubiginis]MBO0938694.1 type I-E CRISPR-associated protein Cse2/CasB [Fibrella rubiginis]
MNPTIDNRKDLIGFLYRQKDAKGRATLAELRRAAADPRNNLRLFSLIGQCLPDPSGPADEDDWVVEAHLLVAMLFAVHGATRWTKANRLDMPAFPEGENRRSFGASLRLLKYQLGTGENSLDLRVGALLDTNAEDIAVPLRNLVQRIATAPKRPIPIDYYKLLNDLINWQQTHTRLRWARDYWQPNTSDEDIDTAPMVSDPNSNNQ